MGSSATKSKSDAVIPIVQVSIKMLTAQPKTVSLNSSITVDKNNLTDNNTYILPKLSSRLCGKTLKNSNKDQLCSIEDVNELKNYLNSDQNSCKYDLNKKKFFRRTLSTKSEVDKFLKQLENEIIQVIEKDRYPHKTLSNSANNELKLILKQLDSKLVCSKLSIIAQILKFNTPEKPKLLVEIIRPQLEDAYLTNQHRSRYGKRLTYGILEKYFDIAQKLEEAFIRQKLSASNLRLTPSTSRLSKGMSGPGMDRAHKVSLKLAVILWKKVYGHDLAYANVRVQLRQALSLSPNIYTTCHHTNRVLHVKYDNEIIEAIQDSEKKSDLSPGAKMRLKQVLDTLLKLKQHSDVMNDFATRAIIVLRNLC